MILRIENLPVLRWESGWSFLTSAATRTMSRRLSLLVADEVTTLIYLPRYTRRIESEPHYFGCYADEGRTALETTP